MVCSVEWNGEVSGKESVGIPWRKNGNEGLQDLWRTLKAPREFRGGGVCSVHHIHIHIYTLLLLIVCSLAFGAYAALISCGNIDSRLNDVSPKVRLPWLPRRKQEP